MMRANGQTVAQRVRRVISRKHNVPICEGFSVGVRLDRRYDEAGRKVIGVLLHQISTPVPFRGKGHASRALDRLLRGCDELEVPIFLEILPSRAANSAEITRGGLNADQLRDWYVRRGFQATGLPSQHGDVVYCREPCAVSCSRDAQR